MSRHMSLRPAVPAQHRSASHLYGAFIVVLSWATPALANEECHGGCLEKAESLMLFEPPGGPLHEVLGRAQELAKRECVEESKDACALSTRLSKALAEFSEVSKKRGAEAATKVLSARQCIAALTRDGGDWNVYVTSWCSSVLDVCGPNLMLVVGHASPADRAALIGGMCAEKLCPTGAGPKPEVCSAPPGKSKTVMGLLRIAFSSELPAPAAEALAAAFEKPRQPFFSDAAAPPPKSKSRK